MRRVVALWVAVVVGVSGVTPGGSVAYAAQESASGNTAVATESGNGTGSAAAVSGPSGNETGSAEPPAAAVTAATPTVAAATGDPVASLARESTPAEDKAAGRAAAAPTKTLSQPSVIAGVQVIPEKVYQAAVSENSPGVSGDKLGDGAPDYADVSFRGAEAPFAELSQGRIDINSKGTLYYVEGWKGFNKSVTKEQSGWYALIRLELPVGVEMPSADTIIAWVDGDGKKAVLNKETGKVTSGKTLSSNTYLETLKDGTVVLDLVRRIENPKEEKTFPIIVDWDGPSADAYKATMYTVNLEGTTFAQKKSDADFEAAPKGTGNLWNKDVWNDITLQGTFSKETGVGSTVREVTYKLKTAQTPEELKKIEGWTGFNEKKKEEQSGWYAAIRLVAPKEITTLSQNTPLVWIGGDDKKAEIVDGEAKGKALSSANFEKTGNSRLSADVVQRIDPAVSKKFRVIVDWDGPTSNDGTKGNKYAPTMYEIDLSALTFTPQPSNAAGFGMAPKWKFDADVSKNNVPAQAGKFSNYTDGTLAYEDLCWNEKETFSTNAKTETVSEAKIVVPNGRLNYVEGWKSFGAGLENGWFFGLQVKIPADVTLSSDSASVIAAVGAAPDDQPKVTDGKIDQTVGKRITVGELDDIAQTQQQSQSSATGATKVLNLYQRVNPKTKEFKLILDWDGDGTKYAPKTYTIDLTKVEFGYQTYEVDIETAKNLKAGTIKEIKYVQTNGVTRPAESEWKSCKSGETLTVSRNRKVEFRIETADNYKAKATGWKGSVSNSLAVPDKVTEISGTKYYTCSTNNLSGPNIPNDVLKVTFDTEKIATKRVVTFVYDPEQVTVKNTGGGDLALSGNNKDKMEDTQSGETPGQVSFQIVPKDPYKVKIVSANAAAEGGKDPNKPTSAGNTWTVAGIQEDSTVTIKAELDESKCQSLNLKLNSDLGNRWEPEITVSASSLSEVRKNKTDGKNTDEYLYITNAMEAELTISTVAGYRVKEVKKDGQVLEPTAGKYKIALSRRNQVDLRIDFEKIPTEIGSVVVKGITRDGSAEHPAGTQKIYPMTFADPAADYRDITAEVFENGTPMKAEDAKKYVEVTYNALKLTTDTKQTLEVMLYTGTDADKNKKYITLMGTGKDSFQKLKLVPTRQLEKKTTGVKVNFVSVSKGSAANTKISEATLALKAPAGLVNVNSSVGRLYYKVVVGSNVWYFEKTAAAEQNATVTVKEWKAGETVGKEAFTVKASLVLLKAGEISKDGKWTQTTAPAIAEETEAGEAADYTREDRYEGNLKVKKLAGTVYRLSANAAYQSTVNSVAIAEVQFDKQVSRVALSSGSVRDITRKPKTGEALAEDGSEEMTLTIKDGVITATPKPGTWIGTHTLEVTSSVDGAKALYPSKATFTVVVRDGLGSARITVPSVAIYKKSGKAAAMKAAVECKYSDDPSKKLAPKTVKWELVKSVSDNNGVYEPLAGYLRGYVNIQEKTGAITVDKRFEPTMDETMNQFRAQVTVSDAGGNTMTAVSDVLTISSKEQNVQSVVIAKYDNVTRKYRIIRKKANVKPEDLENAYVYALSETSPAASYTAADFEKNVIDAKCLTITSGSKMVTLGALTELGSTGKYGYSLGTCVPGKAVLKAKANDGGGKQAAMSFTIDYEDTGVLGIAVFDEAAVLDENYNWGDKPDEGIILENGGTRTFCNTANTRFLLRVVEKVTKTDGKTEWRLVDTRTNVKNIAMSVTGAATPAYSVLAGEKKNAVNSRLEIVANGQTAKIKITDRKTKGAKPFEFTLVNTGFAKTAAPKVTLQKGNDTLNNDGKPILASLKLGTQTLGAAWNGETLYVKAEADWTAVTPQNAVDYETLVEYGELTKWKELNEDGLLELSLPYVIKGSYRLKVTPGTLNKAGEFVALSKPATVALKTAAPKPVQTPSFKPNGSYTLGVKDSAIELGGSGVYEYPIITKLYAANNGGVENNFANNFDVTADGKLCLKNTLTETQIDELIRKNDVKGELTGYADYVFYAKGQGEDMTEQKRTGYGFAVGRGTVKLTIRLKKDAAGSYTASKAVVLQEAETLANVKVESNKKLAYVSKAVAAAGQSFTAADDGQGKVKLTARNPEAKTHRVEFYVVMKGSYAESKIKTDADVMTYGVKMTAQVDVKAPDAKGLIKIQSKNLQQNLSRANYEKNTGKYYVDVPYELILTEPKPVTAAAVKEDDGKTYTFDTEKVPGKIRIRMGDPTTLNVKGKKGTSLKITVKVGTYAEPYELKFTRDKDLALAGSFDEVIEALVKDRDDRIEKEFVAGANWEKVRKDLRKEVEKKIPKNSSVSWNGVVSNSSVGGKLPLTVTFKDLKSTNSTKNIIYNLKIQTGLTDATTKVSLSLNKLQKNWATNTTGREDLAEKLREDARLDAHLKISVVSWNKVPATDTVSGSIAGTIQIVDAAAKAKGEVLFTAENTKLEIARLQKLTEAKTDIEDELSKKKDSVYGNADVEKLLDMLTSELKAKVKNSDISFEWAGEKGKELTVEKSESGKAGLVKGMIRLTNPKSAERVKTYLIYVNLKLKETLTDKTAWEAVRKATVSDNMLDALKTKEKSAMKEGILAAARNALKDDSYDVIVEIADYEKVTYKDDGKLDARVTVFRKNGESSKRAVSASIVLRKSNTNWPKTPTLETLDEFGEELKTLFNDPKRYPALSAGSVNELDGSKACKLGEFVVERNRASLGLTTENGITVSVNKANKWDITHTRQEYEFELLKKATFNGKGRISFTLVLEKTENGKKIEKKLPLTVDIPSIREMAEAAAKDAITKTTVTEATIKTSVEDAVKKLESGWTAASVKKTVTDTTTVTVVLTLTKPAKDSVPAQTETITVVKTKVPTS